MTADQLNVLTQQNSTATNTRTYIRMSRGNSGSSRRISSNKLYTQRDGGRDKAFVEDAKFGGHVGDDNDYLLQPIKWNQAAINISTYRRHI